jgi:hypothetical protein
VSGFTRDWLALRAATDARARSLALVRDFAAALPENAHLADLGAGDGANRRFLAPHLPASTRWTLVDNDVALLDGIADARRLDLATELEAIGDADAATCSALLDLVSADWLERFVRWLGGRPLLAALSVDGRVRFVPEDAEDGIVLAAFAADQRRDKGFGPALGATAAAHLPTLLRGAGYRVAIARSDWKLGPHDAGMLHAMIDGFAARAPACPAWAARRRAAAKAGELRLLVGHVDLLALPQLGARGRADRSSSGSAAAGAPAGPEGA